MNGFCSQLVAAAGSIVAHSRPLVTEQTDRGWRAMKGVDTTGTHMKQLQLLHPPPSPHLTWQSRFILICFISFYSPPMCLLSGMSRKSVTKTIFDSLVWFNEDHWRSEKHCRPLIVNTKLELDNTDFQKNDYIGLDWIGDGWMSWGKDS